MVPGSEVGGRNPTPLLLLYGAFFKCDTVICQRQQLPKLFVTESLILFLSASYWSTITYVINLLALLDIDKLNSKYGLHHTLEVFDCNGSDAHLQAEITDF